MLGYDRFCLRRHHIPEDGVGLNYFFFSVADAGLKPAQQAVVLEALHDRRVNPRAIQNEVIRHRGGGRPYDAQDLVEQVGAVAV